jgi:hypothetical protein
MAIGEIFSIIRFAHKENVKKQPAMLFLKHNLA